MLVVALPAVAWWLAARLRDSQDFQELAREHAEDALACGKVAESPIRHHHISFECGPAFYRKTEIPFTEAELIAERQVREQAARLASYHRTLSRKYMWASWLACLPVAPDPPKP
jgi:hypothetical protein